MSTAVTRMPWTPRKFPLPPFSLSRLANAWPARRVHVRADAHRGRVGQRVDVRDRRDALLQGVLDDGQHRRRGRRLDDDQVRALLDERLVVLDLLRRVPRLGDDADHLVDRRRPVEELLQRVEHVRLERVRQPVEQDPDRVRAVALRLPVRELALVERGTASRCSTLFTVAVVVLRALCGSFGATVGSVPHAAAAFGSVADEPVDAVPSAAAIATASTSRHPMVSRCGNRPAPRSRVIRSSFAVVTRASRTSLRLRYASVRLRLGAGAPPSRSPDAARRTSDRAFAPPCAD